MLYMRIMNSTLNDRNYPFYGSCKGLGRRSSSWVVFRSARPTNFMLAAEWNAVLCHDGGPSSSMTGQPKIIPLTSAVDSPVSAMVKATEFTEYITYDTYTNSQKGKTYDGLKQRFANSKYTTTYNDYYQGPHFKFADGEVTFDDRSDAISATTIELPFKHNGSTLEVTTKRPEPMISMSMVLHTRMLTAMHSSLSRTLFCRIPLCRTG